MPDQRLRSSITLQQAITAQKALEACAKRYRNDADAYRVGDARIAILIGRARDCEAVAAALLNGATVK